MGSRVELLVRKKAVSSLLLVFMALLTARNGISLLGSRLMVLTHVEQACCPQELVLKRRRWRWEGDLKQH